MNLLKELLKTINDKNKEINEALNTKIDYNFEEDYESIFVKFNLDNENIEIRFEKWYEDNINDFYEISFLRNNEMKLLNKKDNSFKILGIVKNIIFDFIELYKPNAFFYAISDNSNSRMNLYKKLGKFISDKYNYKYIESDNKFQKDKANFLLYKDDNILKEIIQTFNDKNYN